MKLFAYEKLLAFCHYTYTGDSPRNLSSSRSHDMGAGEFSGLDRLDYSCFHAAALPIEPALPVLAGDSCLHPDGRRLLYICQSAAGRLGETELWLFAQSLRSARSFRARFHSGDSSSRNLDSRRA